VTAPPERLDSGVVAETADGETGLFVYGVGAAGGGRAPTPVDLCGLDDVPVQSITHGEVAALVGEVAVDRPPGRRREIVAYTRVLDTIARSAPVVPVQFGSFLQDEESVVHELLAPNEVFFVDLLAQLDNRVQVTVRATYLEHVVVAEVVAADPEIAALRERTRDDPDDSAYGERVRLGQLVAQALEAKRAMEAPLLLEELLPFASDHVLHDRGGVDHLFEVALLVDRGRVNELEQLLEDLAEAVHERIRLRLIGPMAAYDFVGDN
jgi:hypothetical protein